MNDIEILEALKCCTGKGGGCKECKRNIHSANCVGWLMKDAFDLINRQKAEIEELKEKLEKAFISLEVLGGVTMRTKVKETIETDLKNKCGSCIYAVPSTFGKSNCYVECSNQEHIAKYCKRPISRIRQRTAPACRSYEEMTEEGDNDA